MANPVPVACPEGAWTPVITNITSGIIHKLKTGAIYLQTYRLTGDPAPTLKTEGALLFENASQELISFSAASDVYIWCDGDSGSVRVDA